MPVTAPRAALSVSPSTAVVWPYRLTRPSTSTAGICGTVLTHASLRRSESASCDAGHLGARLLLEHGVVDGPVQRRVGSHLGPDPGEEKFCQAAPSARLGPEYVGAARFGPEFVGAACFGPEYVGAACFGPEFVGAAWLGIIRGVAIGCHLDLLRRCSLQLERLAVAVLPPHRPVPGWVPGRSWLNIVFCSSPPR